MTTTNTWFFALLVPSSLLFALGKGEGMAEHRVYLVGHAAKTLGIPIEQL